MIEKDKLKETGKSLFREFTEDKHEELATWLNALELNGRTPRGQAKNKERLQFIKNQMDYLEQFKGMSTLPVDNINATFSHMSEDDIDSIVDAFVKGNKVTELKFGNVTIRNESPLSESKFKQTAKQINSFLSGFKGFHEKALEGDVTVVLKKASDLNSKAKYDTEKDEVQVRSTLKFEDRTLPWAIGHELGHRYERLHGLPEEFWENSFRTTRYSYTESLSGSSEAFAEIFVLSLAPSKYPQYKQTLMDFGRIMKAPSSELSLSI